MTRLNILRILLCIASITLATYDSPFWWVAVAPWAVLCLVGIILTIPIVFIIGMGAGAAQADWMSDEFIFTLVFITPTALSLFWHSLIKPKLKSIISKPNSDAKESDPLP